MAVIEKARLNSTLKSGDTVWRKGQVFTAPFPKPIEMEIREKRRNKDGLLLVEVFQEFVPDPVPQKEEKEPDPPEETNKEEKEEKKEPTVIKKRTKK